jgi:phosphatidylglycerophosphatase A
MSWAFIVATCLGLGKLEPGAGTWASLLTVMAWWTVSAWIPPNLQGLTALGLAGLVVLIGIPAATRVVRETGNKDPGFVVIDEVAGQLIGLIAAPLTWKSLLVGFILFRGFDTLKPPPIRQLERLPEGAGIVLDDVAAGLCTLAVMQVLQHFAWLPR